MQAQKSKRRITVVGTGYVGLSLAVLMARQHQVVALDIDAHRIAMLRAGRSPIRDAELESLLTAGGLDLECTTDADVAYGTNPEEHPDFVVIATPTDYDEVTDSFDTSSVEAVAREAHTRCPRAVLVIKSTIPVGFTQKLAADLGDDRVIFSPEFLREGKAVADNLHPSRIVVGDRGPAGEDFAAILRGLSRDTHVPVLLTGSTEAEAIKLFANTFLAVRVAYFNELDTYAATHDLDSRQIIDGVGLDPRIGTHYNNPSFGYGGYCLPKDTKQLRATFAGIPQNLINAVVAANTTRQDWIADDLIARHHPRTVGIHRLSMKAGADNYRSSSVIGVIARLKWRGVDVLVHEPTLTAEGATEFEGAPVVADLDELLARSDVVLANRMVPELEPHRDRVYTRDLFGGDA